MNDERLLRLTAREALEQVHAVAALKELIRDQREQVREQEPSEQDFALQQGALGGETIPSMAKTSTRVDKAAREIADTAHLTGDPEWDGLELLELDPATPLDVSGLPGR